MEQIEKRILIQADTLEKVKKAFVNYKKTPKERFNVGYVKGRIETLESYWKEFKMVHEKLILAVPMEQRLALNYFADSMFDEFEEAYYEYKGEMMCKLELLTPINSESKEICLPSTSSEVKLPSISLPSFSGNYTEWQSFHDLFIALVHENQSLQNVQKLHYLKGSLVGEAETLLRQFATTADNYNEAWSILKKRYVNKRYIANCIFKKFFAQKPISHESATTLRQLLDTSVECMSALKQLGLPTAQWDAIVNFFVISRLDPNTHKQWEELISTDEADDLPGFERLKSFLETRFRTLEMVEPAGSRSYKPVKAKTFHVTAAAAANDKKCTYCQENHYIYQCKQFAKQPLDERYSFVQKNSLCFNCLVPNHTVYKCKQRTTCQICKRKHHSLLHRDKEQAGEGTHKSEETNTNNIQPTVTAHTSSVSQPGHHNDILLATALVNVTSASGQSHVLRALVDQGSEASFVTARAVELLGLKKTSISGVVSGVGEDNQTCIKHMVGIQIMSRYDVQFSINVNAYVLKSVTRRLPAREIKGFDWPQMNEMKLADPTFYIPGRIDLLLGADVFGEIIDSGLLRGPGNVVAQNTHLGWILSGGTNPSFHISQRITSLHITRQIEEDNNLLKKFWEVESALYTKQKMWTKEETQCEIIYQQTTTRDEEGRYVVQLPLKTNIADTVRLCGNTKLQAVNRLKQLERRFKKNDQLKSEYTKVIHEYLQLGHMQKVENEDECDAIYLAHHAVIREDKDTSKVRVVFDASAKGSNGGSLNSSMMTGPTIQPDLRSLIFRWRTHKICVIGDIIKMYRQVKMFDKHTDLQRVVWRDDVSENIKSYKLLTVTFGTSAAPYLAVRTLQRLADDEEERYPRGATIVKDSFYMDDLMTGHEDLAELKIICKEIDQLLRAGGFQMQKWSSNCEELLKDLADNTKTPEPVKDKLEIKLDKVIKILGLTWDRKDDTFRISVNLPQSRYPVTKRVILSDVASLFDPFGWLSPVVITAKIMIQKLWLCSLGWDDELPAELVDEWMAYREELQELQTIEIPRWIKTTSHCKQVSLHGFSDASTLAVAAVVYIRVLDENDVVQVTLLASKTKVAPLKQLTIPRLELCAAVLLSKLLHEIADLLKIPMNLIYAWTDSMVVLSWLQSQPSRWQVLVGNRISEIIQHIDNDRWRHVSSADNPADLASRGIKASDLCNNELWCGPSWLMLRDTEFLRPTIPSTELESKKSFHVVVEEMPIWERFSSINKMRRVLAQCKRFLDYKNKHNRQEFLSAAELNEIEIRCIKYYQNVVYGEEIEDLKKKSKVKRRSSLVKLTPYLDEDMLLRVGGRLSKADLSENAKHPIIIPRKQHITKLIVGDAHRKTLHGTIPQTMTYIRSKFWVIGLRSSVRDFIQKCVVCIRNNAMTKQQLMGQLPTSRVTPKRAFYHSGVDYAGPVYLRTSKGRGHKATKGYICLFVCMCTRAIHLEAVTDLTSQAFIAAFRRFVARRGRCAQLWSDNGTNFIGADKELRDIFTKSTNNVAKEIAETLANDGTTWHFIAPKSPNFGGLWESGVHSAKRHLARVNGTTRLTYEEMSTLLAQVEACLNSRPICQLDETTHTLNPLTPGHFLVGEPLVNIPDINYTPKSIHLLTRWQLVQSQTQDFWRKWQSEYLNTLQQRHKWHDIVPSPSIGDIVIIKEEDLPPAKWLLGKITALHPGPDQLVRVVSVQCKGDHVLKRPLSKLVLLPTSPTTID